MQGLKDGKPDGLHVHICCHKHGFLTRVSYQILLQAREYYADISIWNIETSYYEQKTFWSFCNYMVWSCKEIEMLVDMINISYCAMKLLSYQDKHFSEYQTKSILEFRFELSQSIHR